jgi:hypothetical protein
MHTNPTSSLGLGRRCRCYHPYPALLPTHPKLVLRNVLLRPHCDGCALPCRLLVALGQVSGLLVTVRDLELILPSSHREKKWIIVSGIDRPPLQQHTDSITGWYRCLGV